MEAANFIARQLKQFGQLCRKPSIGSTANAASAACSGGGALKCSLFSIKRAVIEHDVFMSMTTSRTAEGVACLPCLCACLIACKFPMQLAHFTLLDTCIMSDLY